MRRPACRVLGECISGRESYCCDGSEDLASCWSTVTKACEKQRGGQRADHAESCRPQRMTDFYPIGIRKPLEAFKMGSDVIFHISK